MTIVWHCPMTAHDYAAAGRKVVLDRPDCPSCQKAMSFHGFYSRPLRFGGEILRLVVRRARCRACRVTHGLVPDFVGRLRLDAVEVIGGALEQMLTGTTGAVAAAGADVPYTTARDWRRRFLARAKTLTSGFLAAVVALGDLVGGVPVGDANAVLFAIGALAAADRRRSGATGSPWRIANRIVGGELLSANTDPPWIIA